MVISISIYNSKSNENDFVQKTGLEINPLCVSHPLALDAGRSELVNAKNTGLYPP